VVAQDLLKELLQHRGELYGFIRAIVRRHHEAEDLFQEVALVIARKAQEGAEIRNFSAWAKEIARRKVRQFYRESRDRKEVNLPVEEMAEAVCELSEAAHTASDDLRRRQEALRDCIGRLKRDMREMLHRRHAGGEAYARIAAHFGKTEVAVRRATARARLALLACMRRCLARAGCGI
jgi:RNA polymerase sigma-70 factor (ECF subfamily)